MIDANTRAGDRLILAGGNAIGEAVLGDRVSLGIGAIVMDHVTIGSDVSIGAGAVVRHNFLGPGLMVGNPARPIAP